MAVGYDSTQILDLGSRLQIPRNVPFRIRLAALTCVYAIAELAFSVGPKAVPGAEHLVAIDGVVTEQRAVLAADGWMLCGVTELSDGSRGWKLHRRLR
jgi:hypothetical protein